MTDTPVDFSKLTVPRLKALCKERRLTGYSKLGKGALIEKLATSGPLQSPPRSVVSDSPSQISQREITGPLTSFTQAVDLSVDHLPANTPSSTLSSTPWPLISSDPIPHRPEITHSPASVTKSPSFSHPLVTTKRFFADTSSNIVKTPAKKKARLPTSTAGPSSQQGGSILPGALRSQDVLDTQNQAHTPIQAAGPSLTLTASSQTPQEPLPHHETAGQAPSRTERRSISKSHVTADTPPLHPGHAFEVPPIPIRSLHTTSRSSVTSSPSSSLPSSAPTTLSTTCQLTETVGKRFKPLVISKPTLHFAPRQTKVTVTSSNMTGIRLCHLDFPRPSEPIPLTRIKGPLPITQGGLVHCWAVILGGLTDDERRRCALVSRALRYATYHSAEGKLERDYTGRRLAHMKGLFSEPALNWWPYLRQRQVERRTRFHAYNTSFLANFYGDFNPVSECLWASPDNEKQLTVVLRFVIMFLQTRLWFTLSIGNTQGDPLTWLAEVVQDAQEVVPGEIWLITVCSPTSSQSQSFYVLEPTCEVIGHPSLPSNASQSPSNSAESLIPVRPVRSDWSIYLADRLRPESCQHSLYASLKWTHQAEYEGGLSRHWLARATLRGEEGLSLRRVAERYTLACVVGNSVSGRWMSASQMAQDVAGLAERGPPVRLHSHGHASRNVNLFLPAHHHVESVHYTTSNGILLHPALAVVQTPTREYFAMRDNGMQVGCEEDGVVEMWQGILRCDARGVGTEESNQESTTLAGLRAALETNMHERGDARYILR
ncbi:hypothetical protein OF83DRAFT_1251478 [Amylostereum chailletii]|nr:hypothetical protein OF83DRAFT_1251478 [Amylostereum chailletii]